MNIPKNKNSKNLKIPYRAANLFIEKKAEVNKTTNIPIINKVFLVFFFIRLNSFKK